MPRGRPRVKVDLDEVQELAAEGCTQAEIANTLGIALSTFHNRKDIKSAYEKGIAEMKISLRHYQFKAARDGNVQMQIWLGKQVLGQKDTPAEDDTALKKLDMLLDKIGGVI